jgi:hypothetical protein
MDSFGVVFRPIHDRVLSANITPTGRAQKSEFLHRAPFSVEWSAEIVFAIGLQP